MQWVTIVTYCFENEAASGQAEEAVANREPGSQRRRRRGVSPGERPCGLAVEASRVWLATAAEKRSDLPGEKTWR